MIWALKVVLVSFACLSLLSAKLQAFDNLSDFCLLDEKTSVEVGKVRRFPLMDESRNRLRLSADYDQFAFYSIRCGEKTREIFVESKVERRRSEPKRGNFLVLGKKRMGSLLYWEIQTAKQDSLALQNKTPASTTGSKAKTNPAIYQNSNLMYLQSLAKDPHKRKGESPSQLEVFFDHTCPIIFQEKDSSFYWDGTIAYRFEISCIRNSPYAILRVPGDKNGNLLVSAVPAKSLQAGDRFFAKAVLTKLTEEQAFWDQFQVFYD